MPTPSPSFDRVAGPSLARTPASHLAQNLGVAALVLLLHAAALWALQRGLIEHPVLPAISAPHLITAQLLTPPTPAPAPVEAPPPAAAPAPVPPRPEPVPEPPKPEPIRRTPPKPRVVAKPPAPKPAPAHPQRTTPPAETVAPAPVAAPAPATPSPAATAPSPSAAEPAPARTVPPSSSAAYLNNPPPAYPAMSRRLGESGTVVLRVLIGVNGRAEQAQIDKSSGYERLDQAALETARDRWRYVPGTRNGVPEAMWFKVPIKFVLE